MPINQYLFDILKRVDPETAVVNDGESATYSQAPAEAGYSGRRAYPSVDSYGECYKLNCQHCGDTRHRLFFCHLAGARAIVSGRKTPIQFSSFVCVCHNEHCNSQHPDFGNWIRSLGLDKGPVLDLTQAFSPKKLDGYVGLFAATEDKLPSPCYPLTSTEIPDFVSEYIVDRGFDPYTLQAEYGVGYSPDGAVYDRMTEAEYKEAVQALTEKGEDRSKLKQKGELWGGRIIVPVTQGRRLVGWQGRLVRNQDKGCPKYFTSPRLEKAKALFNLDRALLGNVAVLVEGVFDAFRVGPPALAMFGKSISQAQMAILKIVFSQTGGCIVLLDPDAHEDSYKLAMKLHEAEIFPRGVVPAYMPNPGPDPADCSASDIRELIEYYSTFLVPTISGTVPTYSTEDLLQGFEALEEESYE
jgi:hypothetical protein